MCLKVCLVLVLLMQDSFVTGQGVISNAEHGFMTKSETDEIVIDEVQDVHVKQHILVDRSYNSSFTISVPMLSVVVPGTSSLNGIVRFSISHMTLWSLVSISFVGLVYPIFLGPYGRLHRRNFDGSDELFHLDPTLLDHLNSIVNTSQVYEDVTTLVPWEASQDCLNRVVCEAYENVMDFGLAGVTIRAVYSAEDNGIFGETSETLREAAQYGQNPNVTCEQIYSQCIISPLQTYSNMLAYLFDE